ncbi:transposase [Bacillus coahuilensis p1.1.43]|uniref:Transposase n=1 Tax=Bacillus coahuilensis p1.1.43 TaxID=1150625 RepID=A0A147K4R3_9BACI|nr:transposase [Bacillus coahuilensis]KUP04420.1 transposase [Bacillus coahuilensis p1.1.43]
MPRKARKKSRTGIYHVMIRGINQQMIFEEDEDKYAFLRTLERYKIVSRFELYSYCLMDNHVHLLIKEAEEPISKVIMRLSSSFVYWYNSKYDRCGHLFQERFKSEVVEDPRYFLTVLRYIHQNPLKAGLSTSVWESKWTSIREYIQEVNIVDINRGLGMFSEDRAVAMDQFKIFMQEDNEDQCLEYIVKRSDSEVIEYLKILGVTSSELQQMNQKERNSILLKLRELEGVTIRQLSRVTGISKSVIDRIH